jgi:hypothetical protein
MEKRFVLVEVWDINKIFPGVKGFAEEELIKECMESGLFCGNANATAKEQIEFVINKLKQKQ